MRAQPARNHGRIRRNRLKANSKEIVLVGLTLNEDGDTNGPGGQKDEKKMQIEAKNDRKIISATRLEWLKRVKRKVHLKLKVKCAGSSRVEIADAHSTNSCERSKEFTKKLTAASEIENSMQRVSTVGPPSLMLASDGKDCAYDQTVDSTVATDLEGFSSSLPLAAWATATSFDSIASNEKMSLSKYLETSPPHFYLSSELSDEKSPRSFDMEITEEPAISNREVQYDSIFDSILNSDLGMLDDQAILEDSLTARGATVNSLIDFHLTSIDTSVRSVDPRLTRKTIGLKDSSLSEDNSAGPSVTSIREKDSLLTGAKGQLYFTGRDLEELNASAACSGGAAGNRFGLSTDYTCARRDLFRLPLIEHSDSVVQDAGNDAMVDDTVFPSESLAVDSTKFNAQVDAGNFLKLDVRSEHCDETSVSLNPRAETDFRLREESSRKSDADVEICDLGGLAQSSSLSNVSSTTVHHNSPTVSASSIEIFEGPHQHHRRVRKSLAKMIQDAQVSSPKNAIARGRLLSRTIENSERQPTIGRSLVDAEEPSMKRRKEDTDKRS